MNKRALGFDLGGKCGWAAMVPVEGSPHYECGLIKSKPARFHADALRFVQFEAAIVNLLDAYFPAVVYFEDVRRHVAIDAAHAYSAYRTVLLMACEKRGIPYVGIGVGTIKKSATGNGGAKKPAMIAMAKARWPGLSIVTDDVADALHVLDCGIKNFPTP